MDAEKLTTDDLYGSSSDQAKPTEPDKLEYEETPVIEDAAEVAGAVMPELPASEHKELPAASTGKPFVWGKIGQVIGFICLFGLGVWLSSTVRQFLPGGSDSQQSGVITPQPTQFAAAEPTVGSAQGEWVRYDVLSGKTRKPVAGLTLKLPGSVLAPICDGGSCASQGTYLPGGSRLTVAARGASELLPDFRGKQLTDVSGKLLTTKVVALTNRMRATDYTLQSAGTTVGGYRFSLIHGLMIEINEQMSLEINHFAPSGVVVDFGGDEAVFDEIVNSINWTN